MREIYSEVGLVQSLAPVVLSATDTGAAIDLSGYDSALVVVSTGAIVGSGDFTSKLQESDTTTSGDFTDVAAANLVGTFPASLAAASVVKVAYSGTKRYIRVVTTKNSGTSIAAGVNVLRGHALTGPVS
jgi:hypothetical protein